MEVIRDRRSIRKFDPNFVIPDDVLKKIIDTTLTSPSTLNVQDTDLLIVTDKELISKLDKELFNTLPSEVQERFTKRQQRYNVTNLCTYDCSAIIVVLKSKERQSQSTSLNAGILVGVLISSVQLAGLGSCCLGSICNPKVEEILGLEKGSIALGVAIGKSATTDFDERPIMRSVRYIRGK